MHAAIPDIHVEFNRYRSTAVIPDLGYIDDHQLDIDPRQSNGLPGTRAPHVALQRGDMPRSTLDLFVGDFVLIAGPNGGEWTNAAQTVTVTFGILVLFEQVGRGGSLTDPTDTFCATYGIGSSGASLVRPDGLCRLERGPAQQRHFRAPRRGDSPGTIPLMVVAQA